MKVTIRTALLLAIALSAVSGCSSKPLPAASGATREECTAFWNGYGDMQARLVKATNHEGFKEKESLELAMISGTQRCVPDFPASDTSVDTSYRVLMGLQFGAASDALRRGDKDLACKRVADAYATSMRLSPDDRRLQDPHALGHPTCPSATDPAPTPT